MRRGRLLFVCMLLCLVGVAVGGCQKSELKLSTVTSNQKAITLFIGQTFTINTNTSPGNVSSKNLVWTSSNTMVAIVSEGMIKALNIGTTTIIIEVGEHTDTYNVTVENTGGGFEPTKEKDLDL